MTIYYVIFLILFLFSFGEVMGVRVGRFKKKYLLSLFFIFFIYLSTIYYGPVGDLYKYEWYFSVAKFQHIINPIEPFEKGYIFLNALLRRFTDKYWVLRLIQAIITIGIWKRIIISDDDFLFKKEFTSLLCLWSLLQGNIYITRSSIAVVICIYSIKYIQEKNLKKFLLCVLMAILFHSIAVVFIPAYWIYYWKESRKYLYLTILVAAVLVSVLPKIVIKTVGIIPIEYIKTKIVHYVDDFGLISYTSYSYTFTLIKALLNMVVSVIIFEFISIKTKKSDSRFEGCLNIYTLGVVLYFVAINVSTGMTRAALPYMNLQIIMLPQLFNVSGIKQNYKNRLMVFFLFSIYLFARMYLNIQDQPYTTLFTKGM